MRYQWLVKHPISSALSGLLVATAVHWFAVITHGMFEHCMHHGWQWNRADLIVLFLLALIVVGAAYGLHRLASQSLGVLKLTAVRHPSLLLFLSQPLPPSANIVDATGNDTEDWSKFKATFPLLVDQFAQRLRGLESPETAGVAFQRVNWCMPFVAVAHHASASGHGKPLRCLMVIGSADSGPRPNGSWRQALFFKEMIERLFKEWGRPESCPQLLIPFERGVDFYDLSALSEAVTECYRLLAKRGMESPVVDVTGGTKECSIAGAALALEPGRVFQYVSTEDRVVRQYDLTYHPQKSPAHGGH